MQIVSTGIGTAAELLKIDKLNLLLPQGDVRALESATDIDVSAPALHSVGWIPFAHKRAPVYSLSDDLKLMSNIAPERRACAMLTMGSGYIGVLCNDMIILNNFSSPRHALPISMRSADTPILQLAEYEQGIVCITSTHKLTRYIEQLVVQDE